MAAEFKIEGLADLQKALAELAPKVQKSALRGAVRAGSKVIAAEAKRNVHTISGDLARSIRVKGARIKGDQVVGGLAAGNAKAFYAHMVEFGTAAHVIAAKPGHALTIGGGLYEKVNHPGAKKRPFMRPAADTQAQAAVQAFADYVKQRLAKETINQDDPGA